MPLTETKVFRKDDVWLVEYGSLLSPLAILEIKDGWICTKYGWMTAAEFNKRAKVKLGTVRRFLGIPIGIKK